MMSKTVTLCGSMRFQKEMIGLAQKLSLDMNYTVIQPVYFDNQISLKEEEIELLGKLHLQKTAISDAIFVVNIGGYIGKTTQKEIEYAHSLDKEIIYLEQ